jgi:hypothetical protein
MGLGKGASSEQHTGVWMPAMDGKGGEMILGKKPTFTDSH